MASSEFSPRTTAHVSADIEGIAIWVAAVKGVLDRFDPGLSVRAGAWEPTPPVAPLPIALPKCLWARVGPGSGVELPTTIADLTRTLELLQQWTAMLGETLGCLPDTPIPPRE